MTRRSDPQRVPSQPTSANLPHGGVGYVRTQDPGRHGQAPQPRPEGPADASGGPRIDADRSTHPDPLPGAENAPSGPQINAMMAAAKQWLVWMEVPNADPAKKGRKVPYWPVGKGRKRTGTLGSPNDLKRLATLADARAFLAANPQFAGLGFAVLGGFQFIDLDNCRDPVSGAIEPEARAVVDAAAQAGCFTEVSVSGTGLHVVGFGDSVPTIKDERVEQYTSGRFMALGREVLHQGNDALPSVKPLQHLLAPLLPAAKGPFDADRFKPGPVDMEAVERLIGEELANPKPMALSTDTRGAPKAWAKDLPVAIACLYRIDPDVVYPEWIKVGMALHDASGGCAQGLSLWDAWSAHGSKYKHDECSRMWHGFKLGGGVTMGTLVHMAGGLPQPNLDGLRDVLAPKLEPPTPVAQAAAELTGEVERADPVPLDWALLPEDPEPVRFLIPGWLPDGVVTLFAAHGGTGKSYLSLYIALCLATGRNPLVPMELLNPEPVERVRVYLYSAEDSMAVLQFRLRRYMRMLGIRPGELEGWLKVVDATESDNVLFTAGRDVGQRTTARMEWLKREVAAFGAGLLIFDNASDAFDGNEVERAAVRQFLTALKSVAPATLLLAHVDAVSSMATDMDKAKGYSGSTGWHNSARSRWFMARDGESDRVVLKMPKANYSKAGTEAEIAWDDSRGVFTVLEVRDGRARAADHRDVLLGLLAQVLDSGANVSPSPQARNNLFKSLQPLDGFPRGLTSKGVHQELARWQQAGLVRVEQYAKANRGGVAERLVLTETGRAAAAPG